MLNLKSSRNYIIIKDKKELELAKECDICNYIILEEGNTIYIWTKYRGKWLREKYVLFGEDKGKDLETTGIKAYQAFYAYCGREEVERMKTIFEPIPMWESYEQMHYSNFEYAGEKIYKPIYEFDANSAFTYGTTKLPDGFQPLKEYMLSLYEQKKNSTNKITRSKYKNLQNYLIGYFARVKEFVRVRSEVIKESNNNIKLCMADIMKNKGTVYLSNTDSIVTDETGAETMQKYLGDDVGRFKLSKTADRLFYKSSNAYQIGDKVVYSGVKYFARLHTDFFNDIYAEQYGSLIKGRDFELYENNDFYSRLCIAEKGKIQVIVYNNIGEVLNVFNYKAGK